MNTNVNMLSDRVLLNNYLSGDRSAISELIERHSQRVRSYIGMMVRNDDIADDIFQETFIKAVKVIDEGRYTDSGKFLSWVLRIAHNRVLDHFRREKSSRQINETEAGYDMIGSLRLAEPNTEDDMIQGEIEQTIRELIDSLPDEQQEVVRLRYFSKLSFQEIADETEVSINTALGRMRYALINLRKMIKDRNIVLN
ncbi:MAG: sigma-70 family RNA polymerase sigma factor [Alistipes sp.]|nr:sigma-70 family RNA polymerase sigma factor [Alistipes sp.]MEE0864547.1 sigma-70 family RNA polymerase sigma factor [Alistipes sp.]